MKIHSINWKYATAYVIILTCVVAGALTMKPRTSEAQLSAIGCNVAVNFSNSVPVWDQNTEIQKNVKCEWDGVAWQLAHVVLQQLTSSVVNWINSGFNGSPSFVSNPEQFFTDTADQITGALIADGGPLAQSLCSPFSLDIRLSLALGQTSSQQQRYTCTLSQVIKTQQGNVNRLQNGQLGSVSISQSPGGMTIGDIQNGSVLQNSNQISINGNSVATVAGFTSGDFSQGGWPAFIAMTTQPQNNWMGAQLQAQSDLNAQIAAKKADVNADLNRGAGFLSFQKCDNVPVASSGGSDPYGQEYNPSTGASGAPQQGPMQQVCHTETPGSVISSSLTKELGAPTDELNLTNSINQIVSALFSQLLTHVLSSGLLSSSQTSAAGNSTQSYVNKLTNDPALQANFVNLRTQAVANVTEAIGPIQRAAGYRAQTVTLLQGEANAYATVRACLASQTQQTTAFGTVTTGGNQDLINQLDTTVSTSITPQLTQYQSEAALASSSLEQVQNMKYQLSQAASSVELSNLSADFANQLATETASSANEQAAKADLAVVTSSVKTLDATLKPLQTSCASANAITQ